MEPVSGDRRFFGQPHFLPTKSWGGLGPLAPAANLGSPFFLLCAGEDCQAPVSPSLRKAEAGGEEVFKAGAAPGVLFFFFPFFLAPQRQRRPDVSGGELWL